MSFNRKRRSGNDDYHHPSEKRFRLPPMVELAKTLCADLNTLGESSKKFAEDVEFMRTPIVTHFEDEKTFRDAILNTFLAITVEQPQKIPHVAGLIQVVNSSNQAVGKVIIEFFHQKAQESIERAFVEDAAPESYETGPWNKVKLILRLLSTLSFIITEESITNIHTQLIKLAIELQETTPNRRSPLAEAIFYNTLISLPYLFIYEGTNDKLISSVQELIELAETFKIVETSVTITKPFNELDLKVSESKELISLILPAIKNFFNGDLSKSLEIFIDFPKQLSELLVPTEKYSLPQLSFPQSDDFKKINGLDTGLGSIDGMWRTPRFTFEVYLPTDGVATTPPSDSYIGLLVRDIATDIIEALEFNRKEVARQITTLDLFFKNGLFAPPNTSIDALKKIHEENKNLEDKSQAASTWKVEDVAVETVLSLIYKLPTASQPSVFFYTILVEACTLSSSAIAPVMGRAIRFFYSNLDSLDFELKLRYLDWLSVQLSNFNFSWKWREWEQDSQKQNKSVYHPKIAFIRNLISKELRLTGREKIESSLTPEFHQYLDISLYNSDELKAYYVSLFGDESQLSDIDLSFSSEKPEFFFLNEKLALSAFTKRLFEAIHRGAHREEYMEIINDVKESIKDSSNVDRLLISLVFQTVALAGNRSISHAGRYIDSTFGLLEELIFGKQEEVEKEQKEITKEIEDKQEWAIEAILKYWNREPQTGFLVLDSLLSYELITPLSLIKFILKDTERINYGLVNVSAIESIFRTLTTVVYTKEGSVKEILFVINELFKILNDSAKAIGSQDIELPDLTEEYSEDLEKRWKYATIISFVKAILRKFSDEFAGSSKELNESLIEKVEHQKSVKVIQGWIEELKEL